ncbi:dimethylallyl tryptophan synthase 1 [Cordyceps militaris]|uniref:Dimethylallyl tryptophan synthase 1 n=1 Tax=Cordyceps militaris TaxID=73501 RepID=A0A2H4SQ07_CORMI|nr:dimethylallyl tryptophan synthase 1 [Cordyceps militaris]
MMEAADCSVEKQYEALLFHYHYVVPYMGPSPTPELSFEWPCVLSLEGLPIEYSWKWNTATENPEIRYTIEAKSKSSGSKTDPLNQDASREMLRCLRSSFPGVDLTWTDHFMAALFDHDRSKYTKAAAMASEAHTTSVMIAAELKAAGFAFKTYLIPRRVDERYPSLPFWQDAIAKLSPNNLAAGALYRFLNTSEGKHLSPTMLAVDNISPAQSRLKFYFQSPRTNFASTREILTLGGTISVSDAKIELLKTLIAAVVNLGPDFPENAELPIATDFSPPVEDADNNKTLALPGYGYYFDIAPNKKLPEVKLFIRTCVTGPDDYSLGSNLTEWMNTHGREPLSPHSFPPTELYHDYTTMANVSKKSQMPPSKVWESLSLLLPSRDVDCDYWWQLTGQHLAHMVQAAGYSSERQYEVLLFHYYWIWNASGSKPVIRYTIEAMGQFTGRLVDPLNQDASRELLYRLKDVIPSLDLTWNNHLLATLYDHDRSRYSKEITAGQPFTTTILIAVELSPTGLGVKTYYIPRRLGLGLDQIPLDVWKNAIAGICADGGASTKLYDFLDNLQSQPLSPAAIAVDNIKPEHSRLKFYFRSPHSTFDAIQEVMTLGGRIPALPEHLKGLQSLLASLAGTTDALAPDAELDMMPQQATLSQNSSAYAPLVLPGCGYYFNIASDLEYPEIKVFINLYIYGPDDRVLTERISKWMIEHGRGEYCTQCRAYSAMAIKLAKVYTGKFEVVRATRLLHRQVHPELGRDARAAAGLPAGAQEALRAARHCGRGTDGQCRAGHLTLSAVGDKVFEIVQRDCLVPHAKEVGLVLHRGLRTLMGRYGCIGEVRGRRLMAGVETVTDRESKLPSHELAKRIGDAAFKYGLWANLSSHRSFGGAFRIAPPIYAGAARLGACLCWLSASVLGPLRVRVDDREMNEMTCTELMARHELIHEDAATT